MLSSTRNQVITRRGNDYAAPHDLCAIFHDQLDHLYTLALLLTADHSKAEQCFIGGLEDCVLGKPVFRDWARSWTRQAIIRNAIRMVSPAPEKIQWATGAKTPELSRQASENPSLLSAITELQPFERFVYVMSVLEGYSGHDCSILLHCTVAETVKARTRALQQLAGVLNRDNYSPRGLAGHAASESA